MDKIGVSLAQRQGYLFEPRDAPGLPVLLADVPPLAGAGPRLPRDEIGSRVSICTYAMNPRSVG